MISVYCRTNLDLFREEWPSAFPALPRVGDLIQSKTHHPQYNFRLELKVVRITWVYQEHVGIAPYYVPEIELHDSRNRSTSDFYKWYAPLVGQSVGSFI